MYLCSTSYEITLFGLVKMKLKYFSICKNIKIYKENLFLMDEIYMDYPVHGICFNNT